MKVRITSSGAVTASRLQRAEAPGQRPGPRQPFPERAASPRQDSAFTMVEVALSLGIIAFALVAIIGVLPSGLKVQRENREETVVNQDAAYLMEAIRSGSKGVDDLTNYVESIIIKRGVLNSRTVQTTYYTNDLVRPGGALPLTNAQHIVSLLSTPKVEMLPNGTFRVNAVTARIRAISGNALEKGGNQQNIAMRDFAFRYMADVEVVPYGKDPLTTDLPVPNLPPRLENRLTRDGLQSVNLSRGLYEVRVTVRWPILPNGNTGRYRKTLRTLVSGELVPVYTNTTPYLYLLDPHTFTSAY